MRLEREAGGRRAWRGIKGVKKGEGRQQLGRRLPRQGRLWSRGGEDGLITRASQEGWLELCVSCVPGDLACYQDGWMWRGCPEPVLGFGLSPCVPGLTAGPPVALHQCCREAGPGRGTGCAWVLVVTA